MTDGPMRILYVGPDYSGSNGTCWRDAFRRLGHQVFTVNSEALLRYPMSLPGKVWSRLRKRPRASSIQALNEAVVSCASETKPDFTFYIQASCVLPETLARTGAFGLNCAYMNDDMFNPTNQTFSFYRSLPLLDWVFTTKSYNVPEFLEAGTKNAVYIPNAYDATIHYPVNPLPEELPRYTGDVAFIGTFRPDRADYLASLCARLDSASVLRVWGGGWHKMGRVVYWTRKGIWEPLNKCVECRELWGTEMGKAIQANKICLGLLNHANRDLHTSRTFEIPACGGFMLAERTCEHLGFFEEDKEAVYFSSIEELADKLRFYLRAHSVRERIAKAGYARCLGGGYEYTDRARTAMSFLRPNLRCAARSVKS